MYNAPYNGQYDRRGHTDMVVTAQMEPFNGKQVYELFGNIGHEGILTFGWHLNEASGTVLNPFIGPAILTASGSPTLGTQGPMDATDKGATFADAGANTLVTANGAINPNDKAFWLYWISTMSSIPSAARNIIGHDGTIDWLAQVLNTTGRVRFVTISGTTVTCEIASNHCNGVPHDYLFTAVPGGNQKLTSDLGTSGTQSAAAQSALNSTAAFFVERSTSGPAQSMFYVMGGISDGTTAMNDAIASLQSNDATAIANFRTNTGR